MNFKPNFSSLRLLVLLAVLGGVFLRWASLESMGTMLHHDEAWHGIDALAIIRDPRWVPFLPNNFGRESGWVYWIIPYVLVFNADPFGLRLAATIVGILTLAAAYRLGREIYGNVGAFWSVASLGVFYWHVHFSHQALRAQLYVLLGTLTAALLLRAHRTNERRYWILGGVGLGSLAYTYFASFGWIFYFGALVAAVALLDSRRRRGALLTLGIAALLILPIALFFVTHTEQFMARPGTVSAISRGGIVGNTQKWLGAWFQRGDANAEFNTPGRPILGPITGVLFFLGLGGLVFLPRKRSYGPLLLGWGIVALMPSLLSNLAPHFLRASGMTVPIGLILGSGALVLTWVMRRLQQPALAMALPALLLVLVGFDTYADFHVTWVRDPETFILMEQHINQGINYIREETESDRYVYFTPFTPAHPVILFRSPNLAPRPVAAFDSHQCLVIPNHDAVYMSLTMYEPSFQSRLAAWADVTPLFKDSAGPGGKERYTVFSAHPHLNDEFRPDVTFGDQLNVGLLRPLSTTVSSGGTLPVALGIRPRQTLDTSYSLFVHLYGDPTPYEGGQLWGQADSQICASYPAHLWRTEETIVQEFPLTIGDLPPGEYDVAIGVYSFPEGPRLPALHEGREAALDYVVVHTLEVTE